MARETRNHLLESTNGPKSCDTRTDIENDDDCGMKSGDSNSDTYRDGTRSGDSSGSREDGELFCRYGSTSAHPTNTVSNECAEVEVESRVDEITVDDIEAHVADGVAETITSGVSATDGVVYVTSDPDDKDVIRIEVNSGDSVVLTEARIDESSGPAVVESSEPQIESPERQVVEFSEPQVESSERQVESSRLQVESSEPQVESSEPQVESSKPQIEFSEPQVESDEPSTSAKALTPKTPSDSPEPATASGSSAESVDAFGSVAVSKSASDTAESETAAVETVDPTELVAKASNAAPSKHSDPAGPAGPACPAKPTTPVNEAESPAVKTEALKFDDKADSDDDHGSPQGTTTSVECGNSAIDESAASSDSSDNESFHDASDEQDSYDRPLEEAEEISIKLESEYDTPMTTPEDGYEYVKPPYALKRSASVPTRGKLDRKKRAVAFSSDDGRLPARLLIIAMHGKMVRRRN
ncbi:hypothetical protein B0I71DRAFT_134075 [Yarrowia lipolytica]|uniref:Uncharacterized protein n=1 Tax=Yarrowia lipolytica TaxID=4952 RepID=A0A371C2M8_YARLL|nr:hypothetical protein B0I71DRAFT_134075 [Yarrowia lipolytica]